MRLSITLVFALAVSGCADFPALDAAVSARALAADYPRILPIDDLLAKVPAAGQDYGIGSLAARAANLRVRALRLRGPVIDTSTRARMAAALSRHPG